MGIDIAASVPVHWLVIGFALPMIISPGPGNTLLAVAGGQLGVRRSVPFWMGFEAGNLLLCLAYGLGLSQLVGQHPLVHPVLKWAGVVYTLYLAWGFFKDAGLAESAPLRPLGAGDGFVSVMLNPKIHSMVLVMFSQFLDPARPTGPQVAWMTLLFVALSVACHGLWLVAGQLLFSRLRGRAAQRVQAWVFGGGMVAVAVFVALSA